MNRNEVKGKLTLVKNEIKKIRDNEEDVVAYATQDKYLPGAGYIAEIDTFEGLAKAYSEIKKQATDDLSDAVAALGLAGDEIPDSKVKILGFKPETWFKDINTRLAQLRTENRLEKLIQAEAALTKHLSADDVFEMDTAGIDVLVGAE